MLQNRGYRIRSMEHGDLPFITAVRTSSHVQENVEQVLFVNEQTQSKWFETVIDDKTKLYAIFEKQDSTNWASIGYIRVTDIDHVNKSMCIGGDIAVEHSGKGYGKEMYKLIFQLGFETWNMHRLWLLVLENNERARHLYKKMDLKEEGIQREAIFKAGKYHNYIMMSILQNEYKGVNDGTSV